MEDYDTFVQHRMFQKNEEEHKPSSSSSSSLIRFYGQPILPPLLSQEQREDMKRHKEAAQKASVHRKLMNNQRLTNVQTLLHSIQPKNIPTLKDLLQELKINTKHSYSPNTSDEWESQRNLPIGAKCSPSLSPPPVMTATDGVSFPPLSSTTNSAFFTSNAIPEQSEQESCLIDQRHSRRVSQPGSLEGASHTFVSSGYETNTNIDSTTGVFGSIDIGMESRGFGATEGADNNGDFFLLNTSNTIAKMPDIINHPPLDGEELERSALESFSDSFLAHQDSCFTSFPGDLAMCDYLPGKKVVKSHLNSAESQDNLPFTAVLDTDKDQNFVRVEVPVPSPEHSGLQDDPKSRQTLSTHHCPGTEPADNQSQKTDSELSEGPYRFSLQALLKKSQEYRRQQRMLRNQAKNAKNQERAQEQPRVELQSLSDKENDEFPNKGTVTSERKRTEEKRGSFMLPAETPKKSCENDQRIKPVLLWKEANCNSESTLITGDDNPKEMSTVEKDTTLKNKLNMSKEVITEPDQITRFVQQQPVLIETSTIQEALHFIGRGAGKYQVIPAPHLSKSPVHCRIKTVIKDGEAIEGSESSRGTVLVSTGFNKTHNLSAKSSEHKPDSSLPSLQALISRAPSAVTENVENESQTESNLHSDFNFESFKHSDTLANVDSSGTEHMHKDSGHELRHRDTNAMPLILQDKGKDVVNVTELRIVKNLIAERKKNMNKNGFTKSNGGSRKQGRSSKCICSVAQWMHVPEVFRNAPSDSAVPHAVPVLSDTNNHPVENYCTPHLLSLNRSYDVDTPSGLWLLEGTGSSENSLKDQGKDLTPESGGEQEAGVSKVKRRLLMHETEKTQGRSADTRGGAHSAVQANSSPPRGHYSQKEQQEQLKQAHDAQIQALQEEHRRQQEQLQQLALRYHLLQNLSFPCSVSGSRLGDTLTFSTLAQPTSTFPVHCRPLLLAAVKGFLTRRLLRTDRVKQMMRTITDTQTFLQAFQPQSTSRGEICSRQDLLLWERVTLQLRAARYEIFDIFFCLPVGERMQLISRDRELVKERALRQRPEDTRCPRGRTSLSAATKKSLQRKRGMTIQKKPAVPATGLKIGLSVGQSPETKRGQFRANPQRVPKSTSSSRPR